MNTFIRWDGNKTRYSKHIIPMFPSFTGTYIEPFIGSGGIFLNLEPKKWIISDLNKDLIDIWNQVKDCPNEIIKKFKLFEKKFVHLSNEDKKTYCKKNITCLDKKEHGLARIVDYLLMKYCTYLGKIMVNHKFMFSGLDPTIYNLNKYPFLTEKYFENLKKVSKFLNASNGKIYNSDYKLILKKAKKGDFVFLDPPYIEEKKYNFNYNKAEVLDEKFILELLNEVKKLNLKGIKWAMTQADTSQIRGIFKEYSISTFPVYRGRTHSFIAELIIKNY